MAKAKDKSKKPQPEKTKSNVKIESPVIDMEAYQKELAALQAKYLKDVEESEQTKALEEIKKSSTKTQRIMKSSLVNTKYQPQIDDFLETKGQLNQVFKDSEPVIFIQGQSRELATGKLVGYNSKSGDIWVEFINNDDEEEVKQIRGKTVITDIGMIPLPSKVEKKEEKKSK